ncbi:MAG: methionine aminotransferase [Steroidobacteraceae bacterium]|nr:methionine aminotransferase [Steroidobacteraceae bacterium]MDW8259730.1 methionine aminotransferase [Gammaproteobacteria bacterium]
MTGTARSKLPDVGTTIFTLMSRRAAAAGALNIGQGFPDYPIDPELAAAVTGAIAAGCNQYAPMEGVLELRAAVAAKLRQSQGIDVDPETEITITCGGTEGLFSATQALLGPGDNAIVFDPAYDAYEPAIRLAGAECRRIPLAAPVFAIDWERVHDASDARTRLLVLNNPHNPACAVHGRADLEELQRWLERRDAYVLADEVYEHVVFDGATHCSVLALPALRERSLAVYSFGKTLHVTGWRVGYCVGARPLMQEFRKVHQFNTFSIAHPLQAAIAHYLRAMPASWQELGRFFQHKRDLLRAALADTEFVLPAARGTYFQLLDFSAYSGGDDIGFADRLIREASLATIPLSPFYRREAPRQYLRLCIAKQDATLLEAAERLRRWIRTAGQP